MKLLKILLILLLCASKYHSEEHKWENPIMESNQSLFEVTGYPLTGDIPLLNRKIFRGRRVNIIEHPYITSIRRNHVHYLTGTLITKNLVLTVAHPLVGVPIQELRIVVGESYSDRGTMLLTVIIIVIHEHFNQYTLVGDLALLRFYENVLFRSSVKSISLIMPVMSLNGTTGFVTGWGRCDFMGRELCLPRTSKYFPDEIIDPMLRTVPIKIATPNFFCDGYKRHDTKIGRGMLCVGSAREDEPTSPCLAVPGAPLVVDAKLAGILSWGFSCGYLHDLPLVYTSTQHYTTWIAHNILIFRKFTKEDFTSLFQATKSYLILEWLTKTRVTKPTEHKHDNYKELQPMNLDVELVKLRGNQYDIRDFMYNGEFYPLKKTIYEDMKESMVQNSTTAVNNSHISQEKITMLKNVVPFFSDRSLLNISINDDDDDDDSSSN